MLHHIKERFERESKEIRDGLLRVQQGRGQAEFKRLYLKAGWTEEKVNFYLQEASQ